MNMSLVMPIKKLKNMREDRVKQIDKAIYESEMEMENGAEAVELDEAFQKLNKKYYG
jgi:hypothetical protein